MSEDFQVEKKNEVQPKAQGAPKIIDEANYNIRAPKEKGPAIIGQGGDPLFMNIRATKTQLTELLDETTVVQDWIQREKSNNVALACLNNANLKDIYYEIKDGFGDYGPIMLMGFKTPQGVEIPRLKILDKNGDVIEVLSGPLAIDELNKRATAYASLNTKYEAIEECITESEETEEYSAPIEDYT